MKYLAVFAVLLASAIAAKLDKTQVPSNYKSSGGANAGLQVPFGTRTNQAQIVRYENEQNEQGYHYAYETSNGIKAEQDGQIFRGANPEEGSLRVIGSFSYVDDNGQTYSITYTADENGYQAAGDHLPTPPPIPQDILKSLQLTAGNGKYGSQRSSYDADAGF